MSPYLESIINCVNSSAISYTKFVRANDVGATGAHQSGFHIHKQSWKLFFDSPGIKGFNKDVFVTIKWQDQIITESRFIYYGVGTRNEYRLTQIMH